MTRSQNCHSPSAVHQWGSNNFLATDPSPVALYGFYWVAREQQSHPLPEHALFLSFLQSLSVRLGCMPGICYASLVGMAQWLEPLFILLFFSFVTCFPLMLYLHLAQSNYGHYKSSICPCNITTLWRIWAMSSQPYCSKELSCSKCRMKYFPLLNLRKLLSNHSFSLSKMTTLQCSVSSALHNLPSSANSSKIYSDPLLRS